MLPRYAFSHFKRITILLTVASLVVATLGSSFSPILSPANGQDAQNTDIFTGQFIPAYLGAAYDPSEAYKQMAGMPVYVYAYDTSDKIINNYIYKSQIRADGSFQAAGLANASHYGVCVPVNDNGYYVNNGVPGAWSPFRPPITGAGGDGLEGVFAFNEGLYPRTPINPHNQVGNDVELSNVNENYHPTPPATTPDADHQGCRTFFTSNKSVDIANHINIFPLVPTTVLSVIINDQNSGHNTSSQTTSVKDDYNYNTPYEVYAQRVSITTTTDACNQPSADIGGPSCPPTPKVTNLSVSNGPIIRGRTIPEQDSTTTTVATIFQAYAPPGVYAITYWRPDSRDPKTTLTYLSYDGSQPLNTPYNGVAFENVYGAGDNVTIKTDSSDGTPPYSNNQWKLATRDPSSNAHFAWFPTPGNLNIWGLTTTSSFGAPVPVGGTSANIGNSWFGFLDPSTRTCESDGNITTGPVPTWGIYLFSTSCTKNISFLPTTTTEVSFTGGSPTGLADAITNAAASAAGSAAASVTPTFSGIDNQSVSASGTAGPSRRDFSLSTDPTTGVTGYIFKNGIPIAPTAFSMQVDGKVLQDIAYSGDGGKLIIPGVYFDGKSPKQYKVFATNNSGGLFGTQTINNQLAFTIDGGSLKDPTLAMNELGTVDVGGPTSAAGRWLAGLNLNNLLDHLHTPQVFAAGSTTAALDPNDVRLWLDMGAIHAIEGDQKWFTYNNYNLNQIEIVYPADIGFGSDYVVFNRYSHTSNNQAALQDGSKNGIITSSDGTTANSNAQTDQQVAAGSNPEIVGVELTLKELEKDPKIKHKLDDTFRAYQNNVAANKSFAGTLPLTLRVTFDKVNSDNSQIGVGGDSNQVGQDQSQTYPSELSAEWPVTLQDQVANRDYQTDPGPYKYNMTYSPISLSIKPPGCSGGGTTIGGGPFTIHLPSTDPGYYMCEAATGIVHFVGVITQYIADHLITVDPLGYQVTRDGWNVMRNFVNGFATLILVLYGIAIMLRYEPQQYNVRQLMTKLISTILLVNFSILIIQFGIDLANVFSAGGYFFLLKALQASGAVTNDGVGAAVAGMVAMSAAVFSVVAALPGPALIAALLGILGVLVGLIIVMFKAVWYWVLRQIILVICIVVAPVALVARIIPATQSYYAKWRALLTSTLVNQIMFAFVLALAMGVLQASVRSNGGLIEAMAEIAIAIGLFWYSTKFPQKAQSALEAGLGFATVANVMKAMKGMRTGYVGYREKRARSRSLKESRDSALGIDRSKWGEERAAEDERLKAKGVSNLRRFAAMRAMGVKQRGAANYKLTADKSARFGRKLHRVGWVGMGAGLKEEDLDKAEKEGFDQAKAEMLERAHAEAPYIEEAQRENEWEETKYKPVDEASQILSLAKITKQRDNDAILNAQANATFNQIDAQTGTEDKTGFGKIGNMVAIMGTDGKLVNSYAKGFSAVWDGAVGKLNPVDQQRAGEAVGALRKQINDAYGHENDISTKNGFNKFYDTFKYRGQEGHNAWVKFYNDTGTPMSEDAVDRDLRVKVLEDVVIRPATKSGIAGWGNDIRDAVKQATSTGSADRQRITTKDPSGMTNAAYEIPALPTGKTPDDIQQGAEYVTGTAPDLIPARMASDIRDAINTVNLAYSYIVAFPGSKLNNNSTPRIGDYQSAMKTLKKAGYTITR